MGTPRHLIGLYEQDADQLQRWLSAASSFLDASLKVTTPDPQQGALTGQTVGLLFFEPSTRTRVSFELAAKHLGASTVLLSEQGSSIIKGESVLDTCMNLEAMGVGAFVVRHRSREIVEDLARTLEVPLINAGNGDGEHPTQGLLDALALCGHFHYKPHRQWRFELRGRRIAIVGDLAHSRVARSDVQVLRALGATVVLAGPQALLPADDDAAFVGAERALSLNEAIQGADAVIVLRIQRERLGQLQIDGPSYIEQWRFGQRHLALMAPGAAVLHPGPVIRDEELEGVVADGPQSLILQQVRCGVAVRQAVLSWALRRDR